MSQTDPASRETEDSSAQEISVPPIEDALHDLAQPLAVLTMVLDLASLQPEPEACQETLEIARVESRRAVAALQRARAAANRERTFTEKRNTRQGTHQ